MSTIVQDDFGGGIWRELEAPSGYVYDAVNAIVDGPDLRMRGGASAYSAAAPADLKGLFVGQLFAGERVMAWTATQMYVLSDDRLSWTALAATVTIGGVPTTGVPRPFTPGVGVYGLAAFAAPLTDEATVILWGGSRMTAAGYATGTIEVLAESNVVTGTGTAWTTSGVDRGSILSLQFGGPLGVLGVVDRVVSDTEIRLRDPVSGPWVGGVPPGIAYVILPWWPLPAEILSPEYDQSAVPVRSPRACTVSAVANRLVVTLDNRAYFSGVRGPFWFTQAPTTNVVTDYHELPLAATIIGTDAIGDQLVLMSTGGVFRATNMSLDLTDDAGNPQQQLAQISKDLVLWGWGGVAGWSGGLIVPAMDGVYLFGDGPPVDVSRGIRTLYRDYVAAGYVPGVASVHQGHYVLPVLNGSTVVDVLVCRLDQRSSSGALRPAWTRWAGQCLAAVTAALTQISGVHELLGVYGSGVSLVSRMTECVTPASAYTDTAVGSAGYRFQVIQNEFFTGPGNRNTVSMVRARVDDQDVDTDANCYVDGSSTPVSLWTARPASPDPLTQRLRARCRRVAVEVIGAAGAGGPLRLRSLEIFVRDSNRP